MVISYIYGRVNSDEPDWQANYLVRVLHERFKNEFGSIYCRDIKGKTPSGTCNEIYVAGCRLIANLLLEADELIKNAPEEEKEK